MFDFLYLFIVLFFKKINCILSKKNYNRSAILQPIRRTLMLSVIKKNPILTTCLIIALLLGFIFATTKPGNNSNNLDKEEPKYISAGLFTIALMGLFALCRKYCKRDEEELHQPLLPMRVAMLVRPAPVIAPPLTP